LSWEVPTRSEGEVSVFDVTGRKVRTLVRGIMEPGSHRTTISRAMGDRRELLAGLYFVRLRVGEHSETMRLAVIGGQE
jgi:hypothetical protein